MQKKKKNLYTIAMSCHGHNLGKELTHRNSTTQKDSTTSSQFNC